MVRLGGDEFLVVADDLSATGTAQLADRLTHAVAAPISVSGHDALALTVSIGSAPSQSSTAIHYGSLLARL